MAKERSAPPPKLDSVPAWFLTYSDVITLLMTFFILLLTFASTEPERFEQIQKTLFSGAGSTGLVGEPPDGLERDSFIMRIRPKTARRCLQGSEMPPTKKSPNTLSVTGSLAGLEGDQFKDLADQYALEMNLYHMVSANGEIYSLGQQQAKMLALQMYRLPMHVTFEVATDAAMERAVAFSHHIFENYGVKPGQMGVRIIGDVKPQKMRAIIEHHLLQ